MSITQSFLPVVYKESNEILGLVPITTTSFSGLETSFGGFTIYRNEVPSTKTISTPNLLNRASNTYMAIPISSTDRRQGKYRQIDSIILIEDLYQKNRVWRCLPGLVTDGAMAGGPLSSALTSFPMGGPVLPPTPVIPPVVPPTGTTSTKTFQLRAPFVDAPECSFIEINWVEQLSVKSGNNDPAYVEILTQPSALNGLLKMYIMQNAGIAGASRGVLNNTLRLIKISTNPVPVGTYTFVLRIHNTDGLYVDINLDINTIQMAG